MRTLVLAGIFMLLPAALTAQQPVVVVQLLGAVSLPAPLERVLRDYERAWRGRDAAALAALFTEDGFILRPGHPPVRGRAAIEEAYGGSGGALHLTALDFTTEGATGWIIGQYGAQPGGPPGGKFILLLRQAADGRWLIHADMDNGNQGRPGG